MGTALLYIRMGHCNLRVKFQFNDIKIILSKDDLSAYITKYMYDLWIKFKLQFNNCGRKRSRN